MTNRERMAEHVKEMKPNAKYARMVDEVLSTVEDVGGDDEWMVLPGMYDTITVQKHDKCRIVMVHVTNELISYLGMRLNNQAAYGDDCPWCPESLDIMLKSLMEYQCPIMFDLKN